MWLWQPWGLMLHVSGQICNHWNHKESFYLILRFAWNILRLLQICMAPCFLCLCHNILHFYWTAFKLYDKANRVSFAAIQDLDFSDSTHMLIKYSESPPPPKSEHRRDIISFEHTLFWPCWHVVCVRVRGQCKQTGCLACVTQRRIAMKWGPVRGDCQLVDLISALMTWAAME